MPRDTDGMRTATKLLVISPAILLVWAATPQTKTSTGAGPEYTSDGQLRLPVDYREWVYLSSGFDMSYNPAMQMGHHMFDNVFVSPGAWRAFVKSGTWPDKTVLVLEARGAEDKGSINQKGNFQGAAVMGLEVHVKDQARFAGKWAFFAFSGGETAKMIPLTENCYSCHRDHGAVDTTFVQFYPTLMPIAQEKGTVDAADRKEAGNR
jgi:Cytochrome P460